MTIALHSSLPTFSPSPASRVTTELSADGLMISEADYWENYYENSDIIYEWNNGYLEEKPVSDKSTILMYQWFLASVGCVSDSVTHHFPSQVSKKHQKKVTGSSNKGALRRNKTRLTHPTLAVKRDCVCQENDKNQSCISILNQTLGLEIMRGMHPTLIALRF